MGRVAYVPELVKQNIGVPGMKSMANRPNFRLPGAGAGARAAAGAHGMNGDGLTLGFVVQKG